MGQAVEVKTCSGNIVGIAGMKLFAGTCKIFLVDADLLVCEVGKKSFHGIITEPVYQGCAFEKMKIGSQV